MVVSARIHSIESGGENVGAWWLTDSHDDNGHSSQRPGRCWCGARRRWPTIEAKIANSRAKWDPDQTAEDEHRARDHRMLEIDSPSLAGHAHAEDAGGVATATLRGILDTVDGLKFEALVAEQAIQLARARDTDPLPIRRAKTLGVIADRLLSGELDLEEPERAAHAQSRLPATLHLHVRAEDLLAHPDGQASLGSIEKLGPATLELLADWLGRTDLTIKPVLDMARTDAVDQHDPPEWMRELVVQRDLRCIFPWCTRDARSCDIDQIEPYLPMDKDGPPGQTTPESLAPLCRRHHRCKTFTRWRYRRRHGGAYLWSDPGGARYLTKPTTGITTRLNRLT